jgi:hypothetical protein
MSDILHIAKFRPPRDRWHRNPCLHADCRRAAVRGRLCDQCHEYVSDVTSLILMPYGQMVHRVGVSDGYITAHTILPADVPGRRLYKGVGVHRIVMEHELGRPLTGVENVHHINGNRADNRPSNLELWVRSQPSGQRPHQLAEYARELLYLYGTDDERASYGMGAVA